MAIVVEARMAALAPQTLAWFKSQISQSAPRTRIITACLEHGIPLILPMQWGVYQSAADRTAETQERLTDCEQYVLSAVCEYRLAQKQNAPEETLSFHARELERTTDAYLRAKATAAASFAETTDAYEALRQAILSLPD